MNRICLLLPNGFEAIEASVFTDVLGWNRLEGDGTTELITVGTRDTLACTWNFKVTPELLINQVSANDFDGLAIPGGFEEAGYFEDAFREDVLELVREFNRQKKIIATICLAALVLGKSGILEGRNATTYHLSNGKRQAQLAEMGAKIIPDEPIVIDDNLITSSSPSMGFDVAFLLLEKLTSKANTKEVKRLMGFIS